MHNITITGYNSEGEGVGRSDGLVVFVPFALAGETVRVQIVKQHSSYAHAELVEILQPSPERITPECPHFGACGGCGLLHMTYAEELRLKQGNVARALRLPDVPIIPSPTVQHYRNKTTWQTDGKKIGLYARKSHDVIAVEHCLLQSQQANATKHSRLFYREPRQNLCGLAFQLSDTSFFQVNNAAAEKMIDTIAQHVSPTDHILDLYCGVGAIGLCLAKHVRSITGVEINKQAVKEAAANARRNNITNAKFHAGKSENVISELDLSAFDVVIIDPPRAGCDKRLIDALQAQRVAKLIYVSCNPATLARDVKRLANYTLTSAAAVDMFPRTAHVETVCVLETQKESAE
ncbi:MAG: 23S rRNA (uracil(1939)-C(5))-methyltransferase RlmD [Oscillospiraceae bacterium]|nr:23S rRNA (uracil(1939)-C(5))-methyltransferase RlmD [Oscillospiraceae bacterium]